MADSIYHDAPEGYEDAKFGGDDSNDFDWDNQEPTSIAEAIAGGSPIDLSREPINPCGFCGADLETYYHLSDCKLSEDIVGVGV